MHSVGFWLCTSDLCLRCFSPRGDWLRLSCDDENLQLWKHKSERGMGENWRQINDSPCLLETERLKFHGLSPASIIQGQVGFKKLAEGFCPKEDKAPRPFQLLFPLFSPRGHVKAALVRSLLLKFHNGGSFNPNPEMGFLLHRQLRLCHILHWILQSLVRRLLW